MATGQSFNVKAFTEAIFRTRDNREFNAHALELFYYQYRNNPVYGKYCELIKRTPGSVSIVEDIPFLPVQFFRDHLVVTGNPAGPGRVFISSSTTSSFPGRHLVPDLGIYEESFTRGFNYFYGNPSDYCFMALLPGYLERPDSSLIYMTDHLIRLTGENGSEYFLHDHGLLSEKLSEYRRAGKKIMLLGVTFALMDFAEQCPMDLEGVIIMETGGMKGRNKEIVRQELHDLLCRSFNVSVIHSEYGMTELLSQAYSTGRGIYRTPPWMKVYTRDTNDPLALAGANEMGGINIIDLANIHSCAFIATQDLGKKYDDGSFEVLGRFDDSDVRGCSLMVS